MSADRERTVLVVDDDAAVAFTIGEILEARGHRVVHASSAERALSMLPAADVVVTDFAMPGMDGLAFTERARALEPALPVIVVTAHGSERVAVRAMKLGAYDYLAKPFDNEELRATVERALELKALRDGAKLRDAEASGAVQMIAEAPPMKRVLEVVARVAEKPVHVLLRGETGTGKELVATLLHAGSPRRDGPLVRFNCAAVPVELAESELFGHAKGAFTGATRDRAGVFAQASGGTLVLDEVGELDPRVQPKLLRALQSGEIQRVGDERASRVDVRVIASTHRDLPRAVEQGVFREDLYYRLAVVEIVVPPLRDRREDIVPLARHFARMASARFGVEGVTLAPDLLDRLVARPWPGNVRELESTMSRLVALADSPSIDARALERAEQPSELAVSAPAEGGSFRAHVAAFERSLLTRTLAASGGNQSEAARRLEISRTTLIDKMKRFGLA